MRNQIKNEKVEANKLFKRNFDDKKIIEDDIKEDFIELINRRKSKNERRIKKMLVKKNK